MIHRKGPQRKGFALVVSLMMMVLMTLLAVGLLSLASVQLRSAGHDKDRAAARANARLALMQAINQLQIELGPDQRVSAPAALLGEVEQPHWTGVWASTTPEGDSLWHRDPETGGLRDRREETGWERSETVRRWLVSGSAAPGSPGGERIELVGDGSVGERDEDRVEVPLVEVAADAGERGRMAWWTGDLGTRADISVEDPYADRLPDPGRPANGAYHRLLASQQAEESAMEGELDLADGLKSRLLSRQSVELGDAAGNEWSRRHFHDYTVRSSGVLADVREGGLKADLSVFLESEGEIPARGELAGLGDLTVMIDGAEESRQRLAGPTFGLLRDWARASVAFSGRGVEAVTPAGDPAAGGESEDLALCNELPVRLRERTAAGLQPVLVEASTTMQISVYQDRTEKVAGGGEVPVFQLRQHNYPRVVLWNPYNVELELQPAIVMIQGNGRQEVWTEDVVYDAQGRETDRTVENQWLFFEGGRSTAFGNGGSILQSEGYNDPYIGSYYYSLPKTVFGPGECLVFSAARAAEYDGLSAYRPGPYDLAKNQLSCEVAPDPSRSYYVSAAELDGGERTRPIRFWYEATPRWSSGGRVGVENQSDDTRVVMKALDGGGPVTFERFDALPQLAYISGSLQYGAGREPRIAWDRENKMPVETLPKVDPVASVVPDVRTRDGLRLRWFDEHLSNQLNSGALSSSPRFFEEALLANWNPRAAYAVRSPWENLGGSMPVNGSGGGPWFFGAYTRDLYDAAVSWDGQVPVFRDGRHHGNPFGPPQEGRERHVVFELPRHETGVISLGQFQHAPVSEFIWHPSFAIGNSLADPRLGLEGLAGTMPPSPSKGEDALGGFHRNAIGWSRDSQRSQGRDEWATTARSLLQDLPEEQEHLVYDLSYELNHALWDRYYLSSGTRSAKSAFLSDPGKYPLPNGRMSLFGSDAAAEELEDFHGAAARLMVEGAFNVNSTRVEAWKAMLSATRDAGEGGVPFARLLAAPDGVTDGSGAGGWSATRELSDEEVGRLAEAIVEEVKLRGPFLSLSDFVNRRLATDETGHRGALQAAIDRAGINAALEADHPLDNGESLGDYDHPDNIKDPTRLEQTLKPASKAWGAPGFLTQGDVLQVLGSVISARSDSFVVRAYGEALGEDGEVRARAWCEAVVQRTPRPLVADATGLNPAKAGEPGDFGRRFDIVSFRWLRPEEV